MKLTQPHAFQPLIFWFSLSSGESLEGQIQIPGASDFISLRWKRDFCFFPLANLTLSSCRRCSRRSPEILVRWSSPSQQCSVDWPLSVLPSLWWTRQAGNVLPSTGHYTNLHHYFDFSFGTSENASEVNYGVIVFRSWIFIQSWQCKIIISSVCVKKTKQDLNKNTQTLII